jgi:hypothetical protein
MRRLLAACALTLALVPGVAHAFCRATTCDISDPSQHCRLDPSTQCELTGQALTWSSSCVTFSVQKAGAPQVGISASEVRASVQRALDAWTQADCDGRAPSLDYVLSEPVSCDASEYNGDRGNANIVMFRENEWPYEGGEDALGLTRVRFSTDTGELYDADIEINAVDEPLSIGKPQSNEVDLDSLLTHEVGHALGLGHSLDAEATMIAGYTKGSVGLRSLGEDDIAGICDAYPPGRTSNSSCEPRHGFSSLCGADQPAPPPDATPDDASPSESKGCGVARLPGRQNGGVLALLTPVAWLLLRRRGRKRAAS